MLNIERKRIIVDPRAVIVTEQDRATERRELKDIALAHALGPGRHLVRRMSRQADVPLRQGLLVHCSVPVCRIETVAPLLHHALDDGGDVIVEGTQGFALSLMHTDKDYPFVTSRDTTAAGFAMEVGLSPRLISNIVMVLRTFPIRVGGACGPVSVEMSWDEIARISGAPEVFPEFTSVARNACRRVARFNLESWVRLACGYRYRPTSLAVMGLDRLDCTQIPA